MKKSFFHITLLIVLTNCSTPSEEAETAGNQLCENEKALLNFYANADTVQWDLSLSMNEFFQSVLEQTGGDSCDGAQNYYIGVEVDTLREIYLPAWVGNIYCSCCPVVPPIKRHYRPRIGLLNDSIDLNFTHIANNQLFDQLVYKTLHRIIDFQQRQAIFSLYWNETVDKSEKAWAITQILKAYFTAMEKYFSSNGDILCDWDSLPREYPQFVLEIHGAPLPPPPPPPMPDSLLYR